MKHERPVDYSKAKASALARLSEAGDVRATKELERRGETVSTGDVTKLPYLALRALVLAWRDGSMPEERAASESKARAAQVELLARRSVIEKNGWRPEDSKMFGPDLPVSIAPWDVPIPPRFVPWQRPTGSTLYPSPEEEQRAGFSVLAREVYKR